jgi:hypothetical protein
MESISIGVLEAAPGTEHCGIVSAVKQSRIWWSHEVDLETLSNVLSH